MLLGSSGEQFGSCQGTGDIEHVFPYYNHWIFYNFSIFMILHHLVAPWLFHRYIAAYKKISWAARMEWNSRFISSIHATVVSILCISVLTTESQMWLHPFTYSSQKTIFTLAFSLGYFFCDLLSMPIYWRGKDLYIFTVHHMAAIVALYLISKHQVCIFFGIYRLTTELSTPFTNQRWFYRIIGYKLDRRRVNLVTLMFALLFCITRNLMVLPYWLISYWSYDSPAYRACALIHTWLFTLFIVPSIILDCLNIYWARKVYRIGWRSAKLLWQADWRSELYLAKARLHHRLRHIRRKSRNSSTLACPANTGAEAQVPLVGLDHENSNVKLDADLCNPSSSESTEHDSFDSQSEDDEYDGDVDDDGVPQTSNQVTSDDPHGNTAGCCPDGDEIVVHRKR